MNQEPTLQEAVTLTGDVVRLLPMALEHLDPLCEVGLEPSLWKWNTFPVLTREEMQEYVASALRARDAGVALPFVTQRIETNEIVGSTRFGNIDLFNRRAEIDGLGSTPRGSARP